MPNPYFMLTIPAIVHGLNVYFSTDKRPHEEPAQNQNENLAQDENHDQDENLDPHANLTQDEPEADNLHHDENSDDSDNLEQDDAQTPPPLVPLEKNSSYVPYVIGGLALLYVTYEVLRPREEECYKETLVHCQGAWEENRTTQPLPDYCPNKQDITTQTVIYCWEAIRQCCKPVMNSVINYAATCGKTLLSKRTPQGVFEEHGLVDDLVRYHRDMNFTRP